MAAATCLRSCSAISIAPRFGTRGGDFPYLWGSKRAIRPQGLWFLNLTIATQMLQREDDPEIAAIADASVDAIMNHHYNPDIGLNTEMLYFDFTRPPEEAEKSRFGHCVESMWMVMDEANRHEDRALWNTCAERIGTIWMPVGIYLRRAFPVDQCGSPLISGP